MKLLDPSTIRADKQKSNEESAERTQKLAAEESRLAIEVNQARDNAKIAIEKINKELADFKLKKEQEKAAIESEVAKLYEKREELLKPIDEIRAAAEKSAADVAAAKIDLENKTKNLAEDKEKNQEFAESLMDREDELDEREKNIQTKSEKIDQEATALKLGAENLKSKWVDYTIATTNFNKQQEELNKKASDLELEKKILEIRTGELTGWAIKLADKERALKDGYAELQKARDEILGRTT